ncbi:leucyl aminopeptidase [Aeromicrobium sp. Leaf350]|uniref:leucyl aminopeptidase n=1 Tax=Aeromicrobium sp. Leaf350 TaxID=2876565 RepID=UPI001E3E4BE7|nr:leucyl aminopeptidase [Aeromicrobium sp. Leaf350]
MAAAPQNSTARTDLPGVSLSTAQPLTAKADVLVLGIRGDGADTGDREGVSEALDLLGFAGKDDEVVVFPAGDAVAAKVVVAVALPAEPTAADLRAAAARGVRRAPKGSVAVALHPASIEETVAVAEGVRLGRYRYTAYQTPSPDSPAPVPAEHVVLSSFARQSAATHAVEDAAVVTEAVAQARDWVNTPPGDLRPPTFADSIAELSASVAGTAVKVDVWDEKRLAKERCGGILAVGRGSETPPRLVTLTYAPRGAKQHLALVGKGITFDSGGLSIKSGPGMSTMKIDMAGAAAVVTATLAIARLGLPIKVTAYACLAENMPSGTATRPGDVLTMRSGATVEVLNTDAEGRLVLGDGLALATEGTPDLVVDVATLTGACVVALGERTSGILGSDDATIERLASAAGTAGEPMWPLPIPAEIGAAVKTSKIADLRQHNPKPYGGTLFAAAFLREFVGDTPWAHLDIAGPSFNDGAPYGEIPNGGTGVAVRTLVQLARDLVG